MKQRSVEFHIMEGGKVSPAIPQYGGVKGEHNATEVSFVFQSSVYTAGDVARLSFRGGDGTVLSTDLLDVLEDTASNHFGISYPLPQTITMLGGQVEVRLVLSQFDENGNEIVTFKSAPAVLWFEDAAVENGTPFWMGVSEMLQSTATASTEAKTARDEAQTAVAVCAEDAQSALSARNDAQTAAAQAQAAAEDAKAIAGVTAPILCYKGTTTGPALISLTNMAVGDVWYVVSNDKYYMWNGTAWDVLGCDVIVASTVTAGENKPVSGAAVYAFVIEQIEAHDAEAMALLGEDAV